MTIGAATWAYVGQALLTEEVGDMSLQAYRVPEHIAGLDDPEAYFGVGQRLRVDRLGREWELLSVDMAAVMDREARYAAEVEALMGAAAEEPERHRSASYTPDDAGAEYWAQPLAQPGMRYVCLQGQVTEIFGQPLTAQAAPLPPRGRTVLHKAQGGGCSAAFVHGGGFALTAAHCITSGPGGAVNVTDRWCTLENLHENTFGAPATQAQCAQPDSITVSPAWGAGFGGAAHDWALIDFGGWTGGVSWLPMSQASGPSLVGHHARLRGYPAYYANCVVNRVYWTMSPPNTVVHDDYLALHQFRSNGDVASSSGNVLAFDASTGSGMSGGPYFYCPTGDCNQSALVISVHALTSHAGCTGTLCTHLEGKGPLIPAYRSMILGWIP